jgi:hypothetical protein
MGFGFRLRLTCERDAGALPERLAADFEGVFR